jgi:hypothetical protein
MNKSISKKKLKLKPSTQVIPKAVNDLLISHGLTDPSQSENSDDSINLKLSDLSNSFHHLSNNSHGSDLSEESINHEKTFSPLAASSQSNKSCLPNDNITSSQNKTSSINSTSNFQSNLKKNLKRSKFIAVDEFENEITVDAYIRTKNSYPITVTNGNKVNCTLCLHNDDNHQMKAKYMKCNCKKEWCTLKYLIKKCPNSDVCYLFQSGVHADPNLQIIEEEENGTLKVKSPQKLKMRYGIALHVQNIVKSWLAKDDLITPRRVLSRLINRRKANSEAKTKSKKFNEKFVFSKSLLPSLKQVIFSLVVYFI